MEQWWKYSDTGVLRCQRETSPSATASIGNPTGAGLVFEPGPKTGPCFLVFLVYRNTTTFDVSQQLHADASGTLHSTS